MLEELFSLLLPDLVLGGKSTLAVPDLERVGRADLHDPVGHILRQAQERDVKAFHNFIPICARQSCFRQLEAFDPIALGEISQQQLHLTDRDESHIIEDGACSRLSRVDRTRGQEPVLQYPDLLLYPPCMAPFRSERLLPRSGLCRMQGCGYISMRALVKSFNQRFEAQATAVAKRSSLVVEGAPELSGLADVLSSLM